jgi:hypothetical protein
MKVVVLVTVRVVVLSPVKKPVPLDEAQMLAVGMAVAVITVVPVMTPVRLLVDVLVFCAEPEALAVDVAVVIAVVEAVVVLVALVPVEASRAVEVGTVADVTVAGPLMVWVPLAVPGPVAAMVPVLLMLPVPVDVLPLPWGASTAPSTGLTPLPLQLPNSIPSKAPTARPTVFVRIAKGRSVFDMAIRPPRCSFVRWQQELSSRMWARHGPRVIKLKPPARADAESRTKVEVEAGS